MGNVERDTSKTTIVDGEIGRRAKARKGWVTLSYTETVGGIPAQQRSVFTHSARWAGPRRSDKSSEHQRYTKKESVRQLNKIKQLCSFK